MSEFKGTNAYYQMVASNKLRDSDLLVHRASRYQDLMNYINTAVETGVMTRAHARSFISDLNGTTFFLKEGYLAGNPLLISFMKNENNTTWNVNFTSSGVGFTGKSYATAERKTDILLIVDDL